MELKYDCKKPIQEILDMPPATSLLVSSCEDEVMANQGNSLFCGDNRAILRWMAGRNWQTDLVYIDPPFATGTKFRIGKRRTSTISFSKNDNIAYEDVLVGEEYIEYIRETLILLKEVMSDDASLYVHIDTKSAHYFKMILDEVFGSKNFRNDITRIKCNPKNFTKKFYGNMKDTILFYSKTANYIWNDFREPTTNQDILQRFKKIDKDGRRYTTIPLHAPGETSKGESCKEWRGMKPPIGRHWRTSPKIMDGWELQGLIEWSANNVPRKKRYAEEAKQKGKAVQDVWYYKDPQNPVYPTQKNLDMLKMIVQNSSTPASLVMDCFCGSGTTLFAAEQLGRKWVGIDMSKQAIKVCEKRLETSKFLTFSAK